MLETLWMYGPLLLPVAFFFGWWSGRKERNPGEGRGTVSPNYLKGLNYLLNEQQDKAIEVFTKMAESDSDIAEIHIALGNLFRKRGELERAIRVHQNLIARPSLDPKQKADALAELALDYLRSGLLDRAENLFLELLKEKAHEQNALECLMDIYHQEKEWEKAVAMAERLQDLSDQAYHAEIAHFYCEMAEIERQRGDVNVALQLLKRALSRDPDCVRASLTIGDLEIAAGNYKAALKSFKRIPDQNPAFIPEMIDHVKVCYERQGRAKDTLGFLKTLSERNDSAYLMLITARLLERYEGAAAAKHYLMDQVPVRPSVRAMLDLIRYGESDKEDPGALLAVVKRSLGELMLVREAYHCGVCGFDSNTLYWNCPSCKSWGSIQPVSGVQSE